MCSCEEHTPALASEDLELLASAWSYAAAGDADDAQRYAEAFLSDRLGPPLPRDAATSG